MSSSYGSGASIEGIGFAIPSNAVSSIVDDIMNYGYVTGKPQLGISCRPVEENVAQMYNMPLGVFVIEVSEGGAAEKAGILPSDIITKVDDTEVKTTEELSNEINKHQVGDTLKVTLTRNGEERTVEVTLGEFRADNE